MTFDELAPMLDYQPMDAIPLEPSKDGGLLPEGIVLRYECWQRILGQTEPRHLVSYHLVGDKSWYAADTYEDGVKTTWDEELAKPPGDWNDKYTGWAWINPQLGVLTVKALRAGAAVDKGDDPR